MSVALVALVLSYAAIISFDVLWQPDGLEWPLWWHLFQEGGPVEHLQWLFLGVGGLLVAASASIQDSIRERLVASGFALALLLLLLEDAGNASHLARIYVDASWARLVIFGPLGLAMLVMFFALWRTFPPQDRLRAPLIGGYVFYGIAAALSQSFIVSDQIYFGIGDWILHGIFSGKVSILPEPVWDFATVETASPFAFVDFVVEESIELVAAAFLCTVALRLLKGVDRPTTSVRRP